LACSRKEEIFSSTSFEISFSKLSFFLVKSLAIFSCSLEKFPFIFLEGRSS
jgi:hypothetical protein